MKHVRIFLFTLVMIMIFSAFAFAADKFQVGFIPRAFVSVYFVTMADAVKAEAAKNPNMAVQVVAPIDQKDIEGQIKIIEDLTEKKVDLLAIAVNDPKACVPAMLQAQSKGIPIIILDSITPYPGITVLSLIGSNDEAGGKIVGKNVLELQKKISRTIRMAILEGVPGQYANEVRLKGFRSVIGGNQNVNIVASQPANWQRELGMTTMENILQANPDIDIVWGVCDDMALGAYQAVLNAGLKDRIYLLGYDGSKEAVEAVLNGQLYSTILQQPAGIGKMVITIAEMIRTGKKNQVKPVYEIPIINVKKDNAAKWMPEK